MTIYIKIYVKIVVLLHIWHKYKSNFYLCIMPCSWQCSKADVSWNRYHFTTWIKIDKSNVTKNVFINVNHWKTKMENSASFFRVLIISWNKDWGWISKGTISSLWMDTPQEERNCINPSPFHHNRRIIQNCKHEKYLSLITYLFFKKFFLFINLLC